MTAKEDRMTDISTEAVERLANRYDRAATWGGDWRHEAADTLRALAAERDALRAEVKRLRGADGIRGKHLFLADEIRADRLEGTQSHWWREHIGEFALDEDMGLHSAQDAADKRRILRVSELEAAFLRLMDSTPDA
jgi:hypothetical protein